MSLGNGAFLTKVVTHPQWEVIREELDPESGGWHKEFDLGGGLRVHVGGATPNYDPKKAELFSELCYFVNQPEGFWEYAPESVRVLMRRLDIKI